MIHATLCVPVPPTPYHTVPCSAIPCRTVPCRAVPCCVIPFRAVRCSGAGRGLGQVLLPPLLPPLKPRPVRAPAQQSRQRRRAQVRDSPTPSGPPGCLLCLWPSSATWSGLGKLRHSEVTALEKGCEPPPSPRPTAPLSLPPQEFGGLGVLGTPFSQAGGRSHPRICRQPRRKRKENWQRCAVKPAGAGARGPPAAPRPPLSPSTVSPSPRPALSAPFIYGRTYKKAKQTQPRLPAGAIAAHPA